MYHDVHGTFTKSRLDVSCLVFPVISQKYGHVRMKAAFFSLLFLRDGVEKWHSEVLFSS